MSEKAHNMTARLGAWPYCKVCGLIGLKNATSRRAVDSACPGPREQKLSGAAADRLFAQLRRQGWA